MPITVHPDFWGHSFTAYFFAYKGVANIYDYLVNTGKFTIMTHIRHLHISHSAFLEFWLNHLQTLILFHGFGVILAIFMIIKR